MDGCALTRSDPVNTGEILPFRDRSRAHRRSWLIIYLFFCHKDIDFINLHSDQYSSPHPSGSRINISHRPNDRPTIPCQLPVRRSRSGDSSVLFKTSRYATDLKTTVRTNQADIKKKKGRWNKKRRIKAWVCDAESLRAHHCAAGCCLYHYGSYQRRDGKGAVRGCGRRVAVATGGSTRWRQSRERSHRSEEMERSGALNSHL